MENFRSIIEQNAFGVCTYLGEKFKISSNRIRLYFIYISFFTFGSPVIIYFILAFWLNIKNYIQERERSVWDL